MVIMKKTILALIGIITIAMIVSYNIVETKAAEGFEGLLHRTIDKENQSYTFECKDSLGSLKNCSPLGSKYTFHY